MKGQAILFTGVNQVDIGALTIPDPQAGEVVVEVVYTCVSPGTELRCLSGKQPDASPFPFIPGYASVGHVIAVGEGVSLPIGARVFAGGTHHADYAIMWGGHVSHVVKPASHVIPIPDNVDFLDAALSKLAAISYHGLRHSHPLPHETVVIAGLGVIGQMSARLHALSGARVCAFDRSEARVTLAQQDGIEAYTAPQGLLAAARSLLTEGADVLVDATGVPSVLSDIIELGREIPWSDALVPGSRALIQGSYPADVPLPYQAAFAKEVALHVPRDSQPRDIVAVLNLIQRQKLSVRSLISTVTTPDCAPDIYRGLQAGELLTAVFQWRS